MNKSKQVKLTIRRLSALSRSIYLSTDSLSLTLIIFPIVFNCLTPARLEGWPPAPLLQFFTFVT